MSEFLRSVFLVARGLFRRPGFLSLAVLIIGLGAGALTTFVSISYAVFVRPLPYASAERLLMTVSAQPAVGARRLAVSYQDFRDWAEQSQVFEEMAATSAQTRSVVLSGGDQAEHLDAEFTSWNLFPMLGLQAQLGRTFRPEEDLNPGAPLVAVLSYSLWQRRFAGDPDIIGRKLVLNDLPCTVIGVMPQDFRGMWWEAVDAWLPTVSASQLLGERFVGRQLRWLMTLGRLKDGFHLSDAVADMERITTRLEELYPASNERYRASVFTLHNGYFEHLVDRLRICLTAAAFLLLLCCINVSGLMLTRGTSRQREMAVRAALGAGRGRIFRLLIVEGVLLGLLGGVLGVLFASFSTSWLVGLSDIRPATFDQHVFEALRLISGSASQNSGSAAVSSLDVSKSASETGGVLCSRHQRRARSGSWPNFSRNVREKGLRNGQSPPSTMVWTISSILFRSPSAEGSYMTWSRTAS